MAEDDVKEQDLPSFSLGAVFPNGGGWGPSEECLPKHLLDIPYAPFGKSDRLGKVSDFLGASYRGYRTYRREDGAEATDENAEFQYKHDQGEDKTFALVDNTKDKKTGFRRRPQRRFQSTRRDANAGAVRRVAQREYGRKRNWGGANNKNKGWGGRRRWNDRKETAREASVKVQADWELLQQFDLAQLSKMKSLKVPVGEDVCWCGHLDQFDEKYDRMTTKAEKTLERAESKEFYYVTTTDDPVIETLAQERKGSVFATDSIIAHLMASARSVYPFDIVVQRVGDVLFFDSREDSSINFLTVNETAIEPPSAEDKDSINAPEKLSLEATMINQNFSQQVLKTGSKRKEFDAHPFWDDESGEEPASMAYRYRKFKLGEEKDGSFKHNLVLRTEVHAYQVKQEKESFVNVYALNEWDSTLSGGIYWRSKLDSQRGAVLATELKNNAHKMGKWTAQAVLAGVDQMKIGYVSRAHVKDQYKHSVLGTQSFKPALFARQINLNLDNAFGILEHLVDLCMAQPSGKYLITKDPNKPMMRLYKVPEGFGEDDDDDEGESEEEEGGEEGQKQGGAE